MVTEPASAGTGTQVTSDGGERTAPGTVQTQPESGGNPDYAPESGPRTAKDRSDTSYLHEE